MHNSGLRENTSSGMVILKLPIAPVSQPIRPLCKCLTILDAKLEIPCPTPAIILDKNPMGSAIITTTIQSLYFLRFREKKNPTSHCGVYSIPIL